MTHSNGGRIIMNKQSSYDVTQQNRSSRMLRFINGLIQAAAGLSELQILKGLKRHFTNYGNSTSTHFSTITQVKMEAQIAGP